MEFEICNVQQNKEASVSLPKIIGVHELCEIVKGATGAGSDGFVEGREN